MPFTTYRPLDLQRAMSFILGGVALLTTGLLPTPGPAQSARPTSRKAIPKDAPRPTNARRHQVTLTGHITDFAKKPLAGVKVTLRRAYFPQESAKATTDAQGRWQLQHRAYGTYWLSFKSPQHRSSKMMFLLVRPQAIRVASTLAPQARQRTKSKKSTKPVKAAKSPSQSRKPQGKARPGRARQAKRGQGTHKHDHKHAHSGKSKRPKPHTVASHRVTPWRAGALHRLRILRRRHARRASRALRRFFMKRKKAGKRFEYSSFTYPWKPFLAQIKGHMMTATSPEEKLALELMRTSLTGRYTHYSFRKKRALKLMRQYPPTSAAWGVLGYSGFQTIVEAFGVKQLPQTKAYAARFFQEHSNPGLKLEVHYRKLRSLQFRKKFGKRYIKKYLTLRQPIDQRWQQALHKALSDQRGKVLTPSRLAKLQAQLKRLAQRYTHDLLLDPKLAHYQRSSFYMKRYIAPYLQAQYIKKQPSELHFEAIQRLNRRYPHPTFAKRVRRATWMLYPTMKQGKLIPPFKMAILTRQRPTSRPHARPAPPARGAALPPKPSAIKKPQQPKTPNATFSERNFKGKHTLLIFWATWCGPCVRKMPMLHKLHKRFAPHGLQMVSISIDKKPQKVHAFRKAKWPIPWTNAILSTTKQRAVSDLFEVASIPRMFLVGPKGTLLANNAALRKKKKLIATLEKLYPKAKAAPHKQPSPRK